MRVVKEIRADVRSGKQMNRLLQGDVGSGKTLVALMTVLMALDNGFQAALMAPTEILANQHATNIQKLVEGLGIEVSLLTGSTPKRLRKGIHEGLVTGKIHLLIGTHALIEDQVRFLNLGLVIIDEQHRFGVAQRARLWEKNEHPPHVLVMTATPIPRTLAMTLYGDLDVSVIDELPPGRKPIETRHVYEMKRQEVYDFMYREIKKGRQVYVVYPLIKESETLDYQNLEEGLALIQAAFPAPEFSVAMVHGKVKAPEKEACMNDFKRGLIHILVSTTVIEVGVDVPNASLMVIESAERFGLSQLHQLRGRVGRGAEKSYCILMTGLKVSAEGIRRLQIMVETNDGFAISEADLKMRGPGDLEGTQQSGLVADLRIANLAQDGVILQLARDHASDILDADPFLEAPAHQVLKQEIQRRIGEKGDFRMIS